MVFSRGLQVLCTDKECVRKWSFASVFYVLNESPYSAFSDPARISGPPVRQSRAIGALRRKCRKNKAPGRVSLDVHLRNREGRPKSVVKWGGACFGHEERERCVAARCPPNWGEKRPKSPEMWGIRRIRTADKGVQAGCTHHF
jgi:hypothetical protein